MSESFILFFICFGLVVYGINLLILDFTILYLLSKKQEEYNEIIRTNNN